MLGRTNNLEHMRIEMEESRELREIFAPTTRFPFMLKSLSLQVWLLEYSFEFLRYQTKLKKLIIAPAFDPEQTRYPFLRGGLHPKALPHLGFLGVEQCTHLDLMKNRPVTAVQIYYNPVDIQILPLFATRLSQGSVPLEHLYIDMLSPPKELNTILAQFFSVISFCRVSLVALKLRIYAVNGFIEEAEDSTPYVDRVALQGCLATYPALRCFWLLDGNNPNSDPPSSDPPTPPDLTEIKTWKESCPHLKEINIFGVKLVG
ncbi:hypothetical protein RhiJN_16331 [Ceratobasidium sp. AG-Ba]|nr:hypothetical protein RhiJN_16331 [Ceratobasidium sp. AG-Ba]